MSNVVSCSVSSCQLALLRKHCTMFVFFLYYAECWVSVGFLLGRVLLSTFMVKNIQFCYSCLVFSISLIWLILDNVILGLCSIMVTSIQVKFQPKKIRKISLTTMICTVSVLCSSKHLLIVLLLSQSFNFTLHQII